MLNVHVTNTIRNVLRTHDHRNVFGLFGNEVIGLGAKSSSKIDPLNTCHIRSRERSMKIVGPFAGPIAFVEANSRWRRTTPPWLCLHTTYVHHTKRSLHRPLIEHAHLYMRNPNSLSSNHHQQHPEYTCCHLSVLVLRPSSSRSANDRCERSASNPFLLTHRFLLFTPSLSLSFFFSFLCVFYFSSQFALVSVHSLFPLFKYRTVGHICLYVDCIHPSAYHWIANGGPQIEAWGQKGYLQQWREFGCLKAVIHALRYAFQTCSTMRVWPSSGFIKQKFSIKVSQCCTFRERYILISFHQSSWDDRPV